MKKHFAHIYSFLFPLLFLILISIISCERENYYSFINPDEVITTEINIITSPLSGSTAEDGTQATFNVTLSGQPSDDVTIYLFSSNPSEGVPIQTSLTFTPTDWNTTQTVSVIGIDDNATDGNMDYYIDLAVSSNIDGITSTAINLVNIDDDIPGFIVSTISGNTGENGSTATFTVRLTLAPSDNVTIGLISSDPLEGTISPSYLVFTTVDWDINHTVIVSGIDDNSADGDMNYTIILQPATSGDLSYSGLTPGSVSVINIDDDIPGFTVSPISGNTDENGTTATFTVKLNTEPTDNVTISLFSNDTAEGNATPSILTFTPDTWDANQTVTVTGVDDDIVDGDKNYTIILQPATSGDLSYSGLTPDSVSVINIDIPDDPTLTVIDILNPSDNSTDINPDSNITIQFSISMDTNVTGNILFGTPPVIFNDINATISFTTTVFPNDTVIINPNSDFDFNETYMDITVSGFMGLGEPAMFPYNNSNYDFSTINVSCGGYSLGGYCWYLGALGENCDEACSTHSGCGLIGTRDYAGSAGTIANCFTLLDALGAPGTGAPVDENSTSWPAGCTATDSAQRWRFTLIDTDCAWSDPSHYRVCACND
ncbi:Calx-beta domain-containing protein [Spirochaetota bacterium]